MPETIGKYHRVPNPKYKKPKKERIVTITISASKGIKAFYESNTKQIRTYLFDIKKWTMVEAKKWVADHSKNSQKEVDSMSEKLIAKAFVDKSSAEEGVIQAAVASDGIVDREGDRIDPDGWDLTNFNMNPQLLWGHNVREYRPPIGKVERLWFEGEGKRKRLMFQPKFDMKDTFAAELFRKVKEGFLNAFSVGFIPLERDGNTITKSELLEISLVAVPANPNARVVLRDAGIKSLDWEDIVEDKAVVPFRAYDTLPDSASWNASESKKRVKEWAGKDMGKYKRAFAWYDKENPDKLSSYKLPHHDVRGEKLVTNWRGVAAAMASLLGARGGVNVPDKDRRGIYNHLKRHYAQFDKPVPDYRFVEEQILKSLNEEVESSFNQELLGFIKYNIMSLRNEVRAERKQMKKEIKRMIKSRKVVKK